MFVLFNRLQRLSKPASNPFSFPYLLFLHRLSFLFFILPFSLLSISCEKSTAPLNNPQITLTAEYVAVTEAEIVLQTRNTEANTQYQLSRDDSLISGGNLTQVDIMITDTLLLPAHSYTYKAQLIKDGKAVAYSQPLKITTMDTTSHDFNLQIYTIDSPYGSGFLNDVAIVNENDIWVVGVIFADSVQPWLPYNAVHWGGLEWELKRIPYMYNGQPYYHPMNFTFSFENGEVWFGGNGIVKWDGNTFSNVEIDQNTWGAVAINKMWGSSPDNVFLVGNEGSIAHYNGTSWEKLERGTDLPIQDIWGATNELTGEEDIYCIASTKYYGGVSRVLKIKDSEVMEVSNNGLPWSISGIWFKPPHDYYIVGDGIFYTKKLDEQSKWIELVPDITTYYTHSIRGIDINDISIVGSYNTVIHFNGLKWKNYSGSTLPNLGYHLSRMDYKMDIVAAVGYLERDGIILIGKSTK